MEVCRLLVGPEVVVVSKLTRGRAAIFFALGASGFVAIAHAGLVGGMEGLEKFPLLHISMTVTCYLVGTYLYVKRIPEICSPGTFDLWVRRCWHGR
jgi:predicted membrane channel-forming protein YqfA (hemolysin III family)